MLFAVVFAAVSAALIWTTVKGRDAFPFSHYPMFSDLAEIEKTEVFRVALETSGGEVHWWTSEFYRYPEFVGRRLKELYRAAGGDERQNAFAELEKRRCLSEVLRLIKIETGTIENLKSVRVVKRTIVEESGEFLPNDEIVETVAVNRLVNNKRG